LLGVAKATESESKEKVVAPCSLSTTINVIVTVYMIETNRIV